MFKLYQQELTDPDGTEVRQFFLHRFIVWDKENEHQSFTTDIRSLHRAV